MANEYHMDIMIYAADEDLARFIAHVGRDAMVMEAKKRDAEIGILYVELAEKDPF